MGQAVVTPRGPERWSREAQRRIQRAREQILGSDEPVGDGLVRPEIAASWRRSRLCGVDPCRVPTDPAAGPERADHDRAPRLLRAAEPVLDRLVQQLAGTSTAVVLADGGAWILWRGAGHRGLFTGLDRIAASPGFCLGEEVVGTNGLGTVVEERRPSLIVGGEHYQDSMQDFTCVGVPVLDPLSGRLTGVLDLTCASGDTNALLLPLLTEAVREIETRLREQATARERALFDAFVTRTRRRRTVAVASLNEDFLLTNAAAAQLFEPADHALLWEWASGAVATGREVSGRLTLTRDVVVDARCSPVEGDGAWAAGVVMTLVPVAARAAHPVVRPDPRAGLARTAGPVLLHGEPGVGKVRLGLDLARDLGRGHRVIDARTHDRAGFVDALATALAEPAQTVVLRRADALVDGPHEDTVTALVGEAEARVVLTAAEPAARPGGLLDTAAVTHRLPPLRERVAELPALVDALLAELSGLSGPSGPSGTRPRCTAAALAALRAHPWPGNVRELRRVLATALVASGGSAVDVRHLPDGYRAAPTRRPLALLETTERDTIVAALAKAGGHKDRAAAELGISRATIYRKIRRLGIA